LDLAVGLYLPGEEHARRRSITLSPGAGARAVLRARRAAQVPAAA
jgi:hypothetical protein